MGALAFPFRHRFQQIDRPIEIALDRRPRGLEIEPLDFFEMIDRHRECTRYLLVMSFISHCSRGPHFSPSAVSRCALNGGRRLSLARAAGAIPCYVSACSGMLPAVECSPRLPPES